MLFTSESCTELNIFPDAVYDTGLLLGELSKFLAHVLVETEFLSAVCGHCIMKL